MHPGYRNHWITQINYSVSNDWATVFFFISICNVSICYSKPKTNKIACICTCHLPQINVDKIVCSQLIAIEEFRYDDCCSETGPLTLSILSKTIPRRNVNQYTSTPRPNPCVIYFSLAVFAPWTTIGTSRTSLAMGRFHQLLDVFFLWAGGFDPKKL